MILPQDVLDAPHMGCINVHASILPRWRGAAPIQRAIEAGDQQTGISVMRMEAGLDTGPVYRIAKTSIGPEDTAQSIHDRLAVLGAKTVIETIDLLAEGTAHAVEQDDDEASYASKLEKTEAEISWSLSAVELHRRIRAFNPWPVCQTSHRGNRLRIWEAQILNNVTETLPPGTVSGIEDGMIMVSCGTGKLGLKRLQREGAKPLAADEFLRGYRVAVGDVLGLQSQTTVP
jgi:methionyl-tRNA formyltransferase